jgi:hypothetical protein
MRGNPYQCGLRDITGFHYDSVRPDFYTVGQEDTSDNFSPNPDINIAADTRRSCGVSVIPDTVIPMQLAIFSDFGLAVYDYIPVMMDYQALLKGIFPDLNTEPCAQPVFPPGIYDV